ncbi:MAG: tetratricopeptide repeat protein [Nitrospirota bacterium]|nr:tetratricopeptide repeat protein [Nitrospirota bacterium]
MLKRVMIVATIFMFLPMLSGCKQQQSSQWGQGQAGQGSQIVAPPVMVKSAEEIKHLEALVRENPKNANGWIALGNAQMDAQRFSDAIISYQRSLEIDPKNVDVRVDMGTCYRGVGQPEKALEEYRKALKLKPDHINANRNSGVVLAFDLNRRAEGIKMFEKYLALAPGAPDAIQIRQEIQNLQAMK